MFPLKIREEELKIKVGEVYFPGYDVSQKLGGIDFCVSPKDGEQANLFALNGFSFYWAEAKAGNKSDLERHSIES